METIFALIASAERGDRLAAEALLTSLYSELHRLARRELDQQGPGAVLEVRTLLRDAYLDICGRSGPVSPNRARFTAYAARVIRGLIIDYALRGQAQKRGDAFELTSPGTDVKEGRPDVEELTRIRGALDELERVDSSLAEVVDLKFFCGYSLTEIAEQRSVSERTVRREWDKARIYLHRATRDSDFSSR